MTQYKDKADWQQIDPATLASKQATAYEAYKAAYRTMKEARVRFEGMMQEGLPPTVRMVFGYNFGKLSVAIVEALPERAKSVAKGAQSLADFLANARAHNAA